MHSVLSNEDYSDIEESAYEAAVVPELWPKVFARVGEITNSAGGSFAVINERGVGLVCAPVMDNAARRIAEGGYVNRSGRAQGVMEKGLVGVPRFLNEYDYYSSLEDADRDPIVTEVFRDEGFGWAAGFLLQTPHSDLVIMNVEQYFERGPIVGDDLARLDVLYSVFARAATLAARVGFDRVRTAIETLASLGLPAAGLSPNGRVILANDAFAASTHIWTTRDRDRIALHDAVAQGMLAEALETIGLAKGPRSIPVRSVPGGPVAAVIQVIPVRRSAQDVFGSTSAIVVLSETKAHVADATLIHSLFDMSPAEIGVAQGIASGLTLSQIASASSRSVNTVRNQLKSAMEKTGSTRQVELALLMRQLSAPAKPS